MLRSSEAENGGEAMPTNFLSPDERRDAWAAMSMIHEAVGLVVPTGALPS